MCFCTFIGHISQEGRKRCSWLAQIHAPEKRLQNLSAADAFVEIDTTFCTDVADAWERTHGRS